MAARIEYFSDFFILVNKHFNKSELDNTLIV